MKLQLIALAVTVGFLTTLTAEAQQRRRTPPPRAQQAPAYDSAPRGGAAVGHRMAGCGLGSTAVQDPSKWSQVGASLLNLIGMQTFAISFGTSNCVEDGVAAAGREREVFVEANLEDLRRDVAAGEGEYLASMANLYGCQDNSSFNSAISQEKEAFLGASFDEATVLLDTAAASCEG